MITAMNPLLLNRFLRISSLLFVCELLASDATEDRFWRLATVVATLT